MISRVGNECCGCAACANICPKHCIRMTAGKEGFLYPEIQTDNCINCGVCEKACPVLAEKTWLKTDKKHAFGVMIKDQDILMKSSSGGLFTALAEAVFEKGGCVFGAAFTADFSSVHHVMVENAKELCMLRGSKYMQSDLDDCYPAVKRELERDRWVLFTGTPCQIAGLICFLGRDFKRLICADVICHGAPSPMLWHHYLKSIEEQMGSRASAVNFRDKTYGWKQYGLSISAEGNQIYYSPMKENPFLRMFLKNVCLRESCYHCRVKEKGAFSDITMGDLWGVEQILPEIDCSKGVSLAVIHTEKGKVFFEQTGKCMYVIDVDYDRAVSHNSSLTDSAKRPSERDRFFSDLRKYSWSKMEKRYLGEKRSAVIRRKISSSPIGAIKRKVFRS